MKNMMTEYQRELTTNNLHLVKEVIQKRIKINNLPLLAYEDFLRHWLRSSLPRRHGLSAQPG